MIRSFKHKGLRQFAQTGDGAKLSVPNHDRVRQILLALDAAVSPQMMDIPGLRFHQLKGKEKGTYSVRVTGNWRMTFAFDGEDAVNVNLEDYHG